MEISLWNFLRALGATLAYYWGRVTFPIRYPFHVRKTRREFRRQYPAGVEPEMPEGWVSDWGTPEGNERQRRLSDLRDEDAAYNDDDPRKYGIYGFGTFGWTRGPVYDAATDEPVWPGFVAGRMRLSRYGDRSPLREYLAGRRDTLERRKREAAGLAVPGGRDVFLTDPRIDLVWYTDPSKGTRSSP